MVGAVACLVIELHHLVGNECGLDFKGGGGLVHIKLVQIGYRLVLLASRTFRALEPSASAQIGHATPPL